jgi:hypothetical protein
MSLDQEAGHRIIRNVVGRLVKRSGHTAAAAAG